MLRKNTALRLLLAVSIVLLMVNPASATPVDAYGGYVSDNNVNEGDTVEFSGTLHNFLGQDIYLGSFNVTFYQILGEGATREPNKPNITRSYEDDRRTVVSNGSYTETLSREINIEPGSYNVSIFFTYSNTTQTGPAATLNQAYSLVNQTFVIEGVTEALRIAEYIGIGLIVAVVGVIVLLIYNSKFRKSY